MQKHLLNSKTVPVKTHNFIYRMNTDMSICTHTTGCYTQKVDGQKLKPNLENKINANEFQNV